MRTAAPGLKSTRGQGQGGGRRWEVSMHFTSKTDMTKEDEIEDVSVFAAMGEQSK